jgi:hypothetical protein
VVILKVCDTMRFLCSVLMLITSNGFVHHLQFAHVSPSSTHSTIPKQFKPQISRLFAKRKWKDIDISNLNDLPDEMKKEFGISDYDSGSESDYYDEYSYESSDEDGDIIEDDDEYQSEEGTEEEKSEVSKSHAGKSDADDDEYEYEYYDDYEYYEIDEEDEKLIDDKMSELSELREGQKVESTVPPQNMVEVPPSSEVHEPNANKQIYSNPKPSPRQFDYLSLGVGADFVSFSEGNGLDENEENDYEEHEEDSDDAENHEEVFSRDLMEEFNINEADQASESGVEVGLSLPVSNTQPDTNDQLNLAYIHGDYDDYSEIDEETQFNYGSSLTYQGVVDEELDQTEKMRSAKHQEEKVKNVWRKLQQWGSPRRTDTTSNYDSLNVLGFKEGEDADESNKKTIKNAEYYFQQASQQSQTEPLVEENLNEFGEFGEWKIRPQETSSMTLDPDHPPPAAFTVKQVPSNINAVPSKIAPMFGFILILFLCVCVCVCFFFS